MESNIGGFTPGPWSAMSWSATEHYIPEVWNKDESGISDSIAKLEDARLIAAAPELLEALKWMVEHDETWEGDTPLPDHSGLTWNEINSEFIAGLNKARAAIAKATRDQS